MVARHRLLAQSRPLDRASPSSRCPPADCHRLLLAGRPLPAPAAAPPSIQGPRRPPPDCPDLPRPRRPPSAAARRPPAARAGHRLPLSSQGRRRPPPDCPEPPRPRRPPVLASHVARWRSRSRTPRRLFDPREAPRLGSSFGRLLPSSSPPPSSIKGSSGGCASASGSKRKASDCEGASSSAAKNDNANQVVGLDSGSGTPT
ncbi:hypothetical protein PAHAL_6G267900 [Panicum hallii]|uniref:Uncharacterized protein n=1 Tax=Panicum hallii TaxID=206008 RepID=A0A2T8IHP3_9POAL|nr:hypothetical protein PAHAL_6G267900 [Panicum hallii]